MEQISANSQCNPIDPEHCPEVFYRGYGSVPQVDPVVLYPID